MAFNYRRSYGLTFVKSSVKMKSRVKMTITTNYQRQQMAFKKHPGPDHTQPFTKWFLLPCSHDHLRRAFQIKTKIPRYHSSRGRWRLWMVLERIFQLCWRRERDTKLKIPSFATWMREDPLLCNSNERWRHVGASKLIETKASSPHFYSTQLAHNEANLSFIQNIPIWQPKGEGHSHIHPNTLYLTQRPSGWTLTFLEHLEDVKLTTNYGNNLTEKVVLTEIRHQSFQKSIAHWKPLVKWKQTNLNDNKQWWTENSQTLVTQGSGD